VQEQLLKQLCEAAASFYERGYAFGATGNVSIREGDEIWITPTGKALKGLSPALLARLDLAGNARNDNRPSKESPFHLAIYRERAEVGAIVHLHSTYSVALSCLDDLDETEPLPPITPYYLMRVAPLGVIPYLRPGSPLLGEAVGEAAKNHNCLLLRHHGMITCGRDLNEAVDRAEEMEETAKLFLLLRDQPVRKLTPEQIGELNQHFSERF